MPEDEGQMLLRGIDGDDEEVSQQGEVQRERDISDHGCDVAVRGQKAQEDKEGSGQCSKYQGNRGGAGRVLSGGAIDVAGPSHAGP